MFSPTVKTAFVSIHAPTGGATNAEVTQHHHTYVSIHAPTGGATLEEVK